ncbi:aminotransferase class I/II-fold pyridoxal phosphate-dependent enzyme [Saccharopolyspora indica]|uniref:MalY/PatB family protein n=1 Tax=Saccharopolyspora indica TaxID=1229659 RepID=UPI0022EB688F|nr:aminotransferase class I/II-fold pyridoxal phosphate-dependent enzyme [Saccharopolyspora indica]MDA3648311.1 aminotransferase class I/II-fold pyridoxal phosphate-dependent enzyme [Saccharopolyspora indica]
MGHEFDAITVDELRARGSLKWTLHDPGTLGAFVAEMDFPTAPPVVRAVRAAVDAMNFGYLPPRLADEMALACAGWQARRYGWDVDPAWITAIPDVHWALAIAIERFSRPGSAVVMPTPGYMPFLVEPGELGREVIAVPMARDGDRFVHDLDALDAAFRAGGNLLVLCNPHNPLGRVFTAAELTAVCEVVDRHGGRVFADEIHGPLVYPGQQHVPYASLSETAAGHAVTATSATKAWNVPGLKCAQFIVSNDADAATLAAAGRLAVLDSSTHGVLATTAAYTEGEPWLTEVLDYLDGNRRAVAELLAEHLPEVGYREPEGTYLAWLDFRALGLGDHPADFFLEKARIALTDGAACGEAGRGHARLTFATPRPVLERIISGLAGAVRSG